jgi:hypothetical protein
VILKKDVFQTKKEFKNYFEAFMKPRDTDSVMNLTTVDDGIIDAFSRN